MIVLDSSALLAYLFKEPGGDRVLQVLPGSCMSSLNLSEVVARFLRDGHSVDLVTARLNQFPIEIVSFQRNDAYLAASWLEKFPHLGLSLGDRACLSLGKQRGARGLTADRAWAQLPGFQVEQIR